MNAETTMAAALICAGTPKDLIHVHVGKDIE